MSIFTALTTAYSLEEAFGGKDITTQEMQEAIAEWMRLYYECKATKDSDPCQRIAYTVVNKLTKTCFGEYNASSKDEFAQSVLDALGKRKRRAMQMLLAGGEVMLKPLISSNGNVEIGVIRRDNMMVFGRDAAGLPTDIGTVERVTAGDMYYALLERRTVGADGRLTIRNKLYRSKMSGDLGQQVPLATLPRYADLADEYTYPTPMGLGLVHMQVPIENVIDGSTDGVAVYAAAVGLIRNIDRNEAQINSEFEHGKSRVFASSDLMEKDKSGRRTIADDIFVTLDESPEDIGLTIFSPALREESYLARKREYLRNVETVIGIKRGLLSEVEAQERTAKEVTSSEGDYNLTITDLQEVWTRAVRECVHLCSALGQTYRIKGARDVTDDDILIDWGNGVLYDEDKTWTDYKNMVSLGLLKPEIAVGWRFNMPTDTEADLRKVREKYMPVVEQLVGDGED